MEHVIILGSGKNAVNTAMVANELARSLKCKIVNLRDYTFSDFDYLHENKEDDFLPLMRNLIANYENFIFCTPIYWYSMSAIMKTFFDRLSDLLKIEKELGRKLRGKSMYVVSSSGHDEQGSYFYEPFKLSADYLGMKYKGEIHTVVENGILSEITMTRIHHAAKSISQ